MRSRCNGGHHSAAQGELQQFANDIVAWPAVRLGQGASAVRIIFAKSTLRYGLKIDLFVRIDAMTVRSDRYLS